MNATPKTHATLVRKAAAARTAVCKDVRVLAYSTNTGDAPRSARVTHQTCGGEHVMTHVEADLPGDRSIGYCECGEYMDTGTWDERNA